SKNTTNNLTSEQTEAAEIIHKSGKDLLNLINDILDLSKIEAGKIELHITETSIKQLGYDISSQFKHLAHESGIAFQMNFEIDENMSIVTDTQRLEQILKNLVSNAIKFTEKGTVKLLFEACPPKFETEELNRDNAICISVKDTGIGIPNDRLTDIFEAFQQIDGSISRKYGGTGLGLSISKELAKLIKGKIYVESTLDKGSQFFLILPKTTENNSLTMSILSRFKSKETTASNTNRRLTKKEYHHLPVPEDDLENLDQNDQVILIIEDDITFAEALIDFCHSKHFKCIASASGEMGLVLAKKHHPTAIILDVKLPGISGMQVIDELKNTKSTRHIPVHMISGYDYSVEALSKGAIGFSNKPLNTENINDMFGKIEYYVDKEMKELLIIEDDENLRASIIKLVGKSDIIINEAKNAASAEKIILKNNIDCIILDLGLPDMPGFDFLKKLEKEKIPIPPVIIYTGCDLTREETEELQKYSNSIIIKGVRSEERLLDETALFLHRVISKLPEQQKQILEKFYNKDKAFENKRILIVDDDMRNMFALTQVFEEVNMKVYKAADGKKALEMLNSEPTIDLILMDIMMPVMDGYEAIEQIRSNPKVQHIPIIAVTAKAMKEDYEKCMLAGANDYIAKPVDTEKLFNLLRIWLY
ncbi:MAG: response regulator, partial [Bacteroidales bacterium]|nr:response regulator [Bacteroidales bacterium]